MEHDKELRDLLQDHFVAYEAEPDRDIWAGVEAGLGQKPQRRVIPLWWRYGAAIAASLLLLMGVIWLLRQPGELPSGTVAEQPTPAEVPVPETRVPQQLTQSPQGDEEIPQTQENEPEPSVPPQIAPQPKPPVARNLAEQRISPAPQPQVAPNRVVSKEMPAVGPVDHLDHAIVIAQPSTRPIDQVPEERLAVAQPVRIETRPIKRKSAGPAQRNELDLDDLTLANAISFASDELGKWAKSPVEIYTERTPEREVRTYELDILNLRITRKVYRKSKN